VNEDRLHLSGIRHHGPGSAALLRQALNAGMPEQLICFDTAIIDLTEQLSDPVEVLFGVQLGGGTDIHAALAYCEGKIEHSAKTHLVLISDPYEGGDAQQMLARVAALKESGVNVIVLLALTDSGAPGHDANHAQAIAGWIARVCVYAGPVSVADGGGADRPEPGAVGRDGGDCAGSQGLKHEGRPDAGGGRHFVGFCALRVSAITASQALPASWRRTYCRMPPC
jgi:hypothetical protein